MNKTNEQKTPAQLGYRFPAEWIRHDATWLGWPHNRTDWPGKLSTIHWVYGEIVRKLSIGETVRILVNNKLMEDQAKRILCKANVDLKNVEFFRYPTNRGWVRDFGPIFLKHYTNKSGVAISKFKFNAWAKYKDWGKDNTIPEKIGKQLGIQMYPVECQNKSVVLEGGGIDSNGQGTLLTTEECFLDQKTQVRNIGLTKDDMNQIFHDYLGVNNVLWLRSGIAGDDTHGHVDDLCRFVNPTTVVLALEKNPKDINYIPLQENKERLESMRLEDGSKIKVVELPMPEPLYYDGLRLPASYANFYIGNACVIVPTFNDPKDRIALGILSELFKDRPVVGIHAVDLVLGFGTLHCLTQQQPAP